MRTEAEIPTLSSKESVDGKKTQRRTDEEIRAEIKRLTELRKGRRSKDVAPNTNLWALGGVDALEWVLGE